jgi:hypothetical protein
VSEENKAMLEVISDSQIVGYLPRPFAPYCEIARFAFLRKTEVGPPLLSGLTKEDVDQLGVAAFLTLELEREDQDLKEWLQSGFVDIRILRWSHTDIYGSAYEVEADQLEKVRKIPKFKPI